MLKLVEISALYCFVSTVYHRRLNVEETKDRMDEDDKNEDGQITWAEYLQAIYSMTEEELQDYRKSDLDEEARKQFDIVSFHLINVF